MTPIYHDGDRYDAEVHLETIADLVVMSRASGFLVDAHSGFSRMAAYLGAHVMDGGACLRYNQECDRSWLDAVNKDVENENPKP